MKRCPQCGTENNDEYVFCISCGTRLPQTEDAGPVGSMAQGPIMVGPAEPSSTPPQPELPAANEVTPEPPSVTPTAMPSPPPPPPQVHFSPDAVPPRPATGETSQLGLWALVLGILSVTCLCCSGVILGPIAISVALQARKTPSADQGMATAGLVLGIIGTVLGVLSILTILARGALQN